MQFRDMRHQLEPNEQRLADWLQQARERFFHNLTLLQLQVPELAQQLRSHKWQQQTLCCDRAGVGNLVEHESLKMLWPPRPFRPSYKALAPQPQYALVAATLTDDGEQLIAAINGLQSSAVLLYVEQLDTLVASFHCCDWTSVMQKTQLLFQVGVSQTQFAADRDILQEHGIRTFPFTELAHTTAETNDANADEHGWHFQQAMQYCHDSDPSLRPQTHKFKKQREFALQNQLIEHIRTAPLTLNGVSNLLLCGAHPGVLHAVYQLPKLQRIIWLHNEQPFPERQRFAQRGIEVVECIADSNHLPDKLFACLQQLPPETAWQLRLYQGEDNASARQTRMLAELELRYWVQPAMGLERTLQTMFNAVVEPQQFLTRRTQWPCSENTALPVLVLGNGPSLNKAIQAIKAGQAKGYIIASCGSTLTTLLNHGIQPHVHLELELSAWHIRRLTPEQLRDTTLLAPAGFNHEERAQFGAALSFMLSGHTVDELLPGFPDDTIRIEHAFPTVLNLAIPLFAELGAEEIWLSGVDFAFASITEHHAQGSYYDQQDPSHYAKISGELIPVTGVHGDALLTKREFQLAALQASLAIERVGAKVYQLSEGLDFGGQPVTELTPRNSDIPATLFNRCSQAQLGWKKLPVQLNVAAVFSPWLESTGSPSTGSPSTGLPRKQELHTLLSHPRYQARVQRNLHQPMPLWAEPLNRNIAALLLHLIEQERLTADTMEQLKTELTALLASLQPWIAKLSP